MRLSACFSLCILLVIYFSWAESKVLRSKNQNNSKSVGSPLARGVFLNETGDRLFNLSLKALNPKKVGNASSGQRAAALKKKRRQKIIQCCGKLSCFGPSYRVTYNGSRRGKTTVKTGNGDAAKSATPANTAITKATEAPAAGDEEEGDSGDAPAEGGGDAPASEAPATEAPATEAPAAPTEPETEPPTDPPETTPAPVGYTGATAGEDGDYGK